jgi:N-acetyl-alpha-D-muramate 1-phosphate uridylyltransferase
MMALMLFAAGFGKRMGHLTADRPKPLVPVAGRALIDHALAVADGARVGRIVVNLHYRGDQIVKHLAGRHDIQFSDERAMILETGGGLRHALVLLGSGPVLTLNTDAVWTGANPLSQLMAAWKPDVMDGLLLLLPADAAIGHTGGADFALSPEGRINRGQGGEDHVYLGAQILKTEGLQDVTEDAFSLNRLWDQMIGAGRAFGLVHDGAWCDVGSPAGITLAEQLLSGRPAS